MGPQIWRQVRPGLLYPTKFLRSHCAPRIICNRDEDGLTDKSGSDLYMCIEISDSTSMLASAFCIFDVQLRAGRANLVLKTICTTLHRDMRFNSPSFFPASTHILDLRLLLGEFFKGDSSKCTYSDIQVSRWIGARGHPHRLC